MATGRRVYLDYNASAPLLGEAAEAMRAVIGLTGNPSSVHAEGRKLRAIVEAARADVAALVNARVSEVVFTSGASEANATVVRAGWSAIAAARVEHDSVHAPMAASGADIIGLAVDGSGRVDPAALDTALARQTQTGPSAARARRLVALQLANNETGVIQPVAEAAAVAHARGALLHTDAVQAPGRIAVDFAALGADTMALSAHKLGGPAGVGALVVRDGVELPVMIGGGGQERRRRAGTENVIGIAGFGAAARAALRRLGEAGRVAALRDRLEAALIEITPDAMMVGAGAGRLPNTTCIVRDGFSSEITIIKLDVAGFAVSAGSACSSGKVGPSPVLQAIGLPPHLARSGLRISLGRETTAADIAGFIAAWRDLAGTAAPARSAKTTLIEKGGRAPVRTVAIGE